MGKGGKGKDGKGGGGEERREVFVPVVKIH